MPRGEIDADLEDLSCEKLLFLVQQIMECLQNENGESPQTLIIGSNTLMLMVDEYEFSITILQKNMIN